MALIFIIRRIDVAVLRRRCGGAVERHDSRCSSISLEKWLGREGNMNIRYFTSDSPEDTIGIGRKIGESLKGGELIAYRGGLGAGKTTMTRGIALGMGLPDNVSSPTFAIVNEYHGKGRLSLYHFDLYRIRNRDELEAAGFYDYMSKDSVIAAEWSENAAEEFDRAIVITLEGSENRRRITIEDKR